MTYRPLPDNLTIGISEIEGLGLFATEFIPAGTELGMSHFYWGETLMRTPLGGFYNHSDEPNIEKYQRDSRFFLMTIEDIEPLEELVCEYTFYELSYPSNDNTTPKLRLV